MKRIFRVLAGLFSLGLALNGMIVVAEHETNPFVSDITTTFPMTYASCVDAVTSDTITFENVGDRHLLGQVIVQYVTDSGRETVPGGFYPVDNVGDLTLEVQYPPVSEWPVQSNGTAEIHVDIQVEVFNQDGFLLGLIGPAHDWDVFCLNPPPPSEPPPPPPPPDDGIEGCTLTQGYWKTHSEFGPAPFDDTWTMLANGASTEFFLSGQTYHDVLWTPPRGGNAYYILAHQYIATELNQLNGASVPDDVMSAFNTATEVFETFTPDEVNAMKRGNKDQREAIINLASILDDYNNGLLGPDHCDD